MVPSPLPRLWVLISFSFGRFSWLCLRAYSTLSNRDRRTPSSGHRPVEQWFPLRYHVYGCSFRSPSVVSRGCAFAPTRRYPTEIDGRHPAAIGPLNNGSLSATTSMGAHFVLLRSFLVVVPSRLLDVIQQRSTDAIQRPSAR